MDKENMVHIHNGILLSHKKNEIMPTAATWMDLQIIILNDVRRKRQIPLSTHMWNLKYNMNELIYETDLETWITDL